MTIAALLHDLETASAGSRELSDRVLLAMGWRRVRNTGGLQLTSHWEAADGSVVEVVPSPTESVDWLLANVPEGWRTYRAHEIIGTGWYWVLEKVGASTATGHAQVVASSEVKTAALALCAAILRAMVAEGRIAE